MKTFQTVTKIGKATFKMRKWDKVNSIHAGHRAIHLFVLLIIISIIPGVSSSSPPLEGIGSVRARAGEVLTGRWIWLDYQCKQCC